MIKVSFIIIGYNIEKYFDRALQSEMNQTLKDIEIIFVNDGSKDNTEKIALEYSQIDSRIKVINQQNLGANVARKNGFFNANGEFIVFIDGDDWIEVDLAEKLYNRASEGDYDIISFGHYVAYDHKKEKSSIEKTGIMNNYEYLDLIIVNELSHNLWNKFIKCDFLKKSGFNDIPNITMGDDLAANIRFGLYKPKALVIDEYYYNYYQSTDSITRTTSMKILEINDAIKDIEINLEKHGLTDIYREHVEFIKFHIFFTRVVKSRFKENTVQKILYKQWKGMKINYKKNKICIKFINNLPFSEKVLLRLYLLNYKVGYVFSVFYLKLKKRLIE